MPARHLHLLLPFALPNLASLPPQLKNPAFDILLARAAFQECIHGEAFQRSLAHEHWIARQFNALAPNAHDQTPLAPYMLLAEGGMPGDAVWACVEPVHVHIAHDHLMLIDPLSLDLPRDEAAALLAVARPLLETLEVRLEAPSPKRWYLSSDTLGMLDSVSPLRAAGRNMEIWLPHESHTGKRSRAWMRLQNEVQMAWFEHPVNVAREARGALPINSIWIHGQGAARSVVSPFCCVMSKAPATRGLGLAAGAQAALPPDNASRMPLSGPTLIELDCLSAPFIAQDWVGWQAAFGMLERDWFGPALTALKNGRLDTISMTLCNETGAATFAVTRGSLRKFWRRRSFAAVCRTLLIE